MENNDYDKILENYSGKKTVSEKEKAKAKKINDDRFIIPEKKLISLVARDTGYYVDDVGQIIKKLNEVLIRELSNRPIVIKLGHFVFESKLCERQYARDVRADKIMVKEPHLRCKVVVARVFRKFLSKNIFDMNGKFVERDKGQPSNERLGIDAPRKRISKKTT